MRWQHGRRSLTIEDRRGSRVATAGGGGLRVMALVVFLLGGDPTALLVEGAGQALAPRLSPAEEQEQADFTAAVLGGTEDVWTALFRREGEAYGEPVLVLFSGMVDSGCGLAQAAVGPFYCPLDNKVYLDLNFFHDLEHRIGAPGDFARAYVIAHEVGHHVQNLLGTAERVSRAQEARPEEANRLSVRLELQADCYAGIWAHYAQADYDMLEPGDIDEALNAAAQIGDDRLQKRGQGYVVPDSFTHGTAAQRHDWFRRGFENGERAACDTFADAA